MTLDTKSLRYFLAVAREASFTKAAKSLRMTQPPLSRRIKELEEEIGKPLFVRGSRRITLTPEGKLLRKRAQEMVALLEKTESELKSADSDIAGDIYLGCGETVAMDIVAGVAEGMKRAHPRIRFHIFSGDADRVTERLDKGLVDFGLLIGVADFEKYDHLPLPTSDAWGVLARSDSPLASKATATPEDIRGEPLILSRQSVESKEMLAWLGAAAPDLNVVVTSDLVYNATHFVRHGFGYAVTLAGLVPTSGESGLVFLPLEPPLEACLSIVWKRNQVFSRASAEFLSAMRDALARAS